MEAYNRDIVEISPALNVTRQDAIDSTLNDKIDALTDTINKPIQSMIKYIAMIKEYVTGQIEDLEYNQNEKINELSKASFNG